MAKKKSKLPEATIPKTIPIREINPLDEALSLPYSGESLRPLTSVDELLTNGEALTTLAEDVASGASIRSVELKLGLPDGLLKEWLNIGRTERQGPFRALYAYYMRASADARIGAESRLLVKNPLAWLEKFEASDELTREDPNLSVPGTAHPSGQKHPSLAPPEIEEGHIEVPEPEPDTPSSPEEKE